VQPQVDYQRRPRRLLSISDGLKRFWHLAGTYNGEPLFISSQPQRQNQKNQSGGQVRDRNPLTRGEQARGPRTPNGRTRWHPQGHRRSPLVGVRRNRGRQQLESRNNAVRGVWGSGGLSLGGLRVTVRLSGGSEQVWYAGGGERCGDYRRWKTVGFSGEDVLPWGGLTYLSRRGILSCAG